MKRFKFNTGNRKPYDGRQGIANVARKSSIKKNNQKQVTTSAMSVNAYSDVLDLSNMKF